MLSVWDKLKWNLQKRVFPVISLRQTETKFTEESVSCYQFETNWSEIYRRELVLCYQFEINWSRLIEERCLRTVLSWNFLIAHGWDPLRAWIWLKLTPTLHGFEHAATNISNKIFGGPQEVIFNRRFVLKSDWDKLTPTDTVQSIKFVLRIFRLVIISCILELNIQ